MILTPAQEKIIKSGKRFRVLNCGRRFGKTTLALEEIIALALSRPVKVAYLAKTYQQARDIAWEDLKSRTEGLKPVVNEQRLELRIRTHDGKGESKIVLRGWESVDALRGQYFDFLVLDEVAMMRNFLFHWKEVLRPTLSDKKGSAMFISTPKGFNHFYDLFNKQMDDPALWESFHFTTYDNPHIDPAEIDSAKEELDPDSFAQEYLADFRKQTGLVYKEFMRERHVYSGDVVINTVDTIAGLDFGFRHPTALLTIQVDNQGVFWVTDEWYEVEKTHDQIAEYVASCDFNKVYPDPEDQAAIRVLENSRVNCMTVNKGPGSVNAGIQRLKSLFKQGKIKVHASCKNLIWELEMYAYDEKKVDVPIKENDDAVDALRYAISTYSPKTHVNVHKVARVLNKRIASGKNISV